MAWIRLHTKFYKIVQIIEHCVGDRTTVNLSKDAHVLGHMRLQNRHFHEKVTINNDQITFYTSEYIDRPIDVL